ncbi:hypothetical protein HYH03_015653 [Edaphochlamys debaryana]|uniref:Uncharacterized protein n=1 Tax=Edaphochlamys debaryana TaxID=47281 RepID=A0A835XMP3_9CHLO|nr:hypothetical protein HYH03_015653 [Edaphochlamys debaryana]|eukprot:KAG2485588.1 hypothetical protein HYH03_015653 [Edaphochlamys debaryana]
MSETVYHPAAEIVAIALRKICKLANSRKYAKLLEECRFFLDELHLIIPAAGTAGGKRLLVYGRDPGSAVDLPSQAGPGAGASRRASVDGRQPPSTTPVPEDSGVPTPRAPAEPGTPATEFNGEDIAETASTPAEGAAPPTGEGAPATAAPAGGEPTPSTSTPPPAEPAAAPEPTAAAAMEPSPPSASSASATSAAGGHKAPHLTPPPPIAPEPELPDLVPRTDTALPDPVCDRVIGIFRLAVDTQRPDVIEVALDCIQKLVAFRFLQGAVYAVNAQQGGPGGAAKDGDEAGAGAGGAAEGSAAEGAARKPQAQAVELICACEQIPDDKVELQILKNLLTATTSTTFTVHGQALLLAVRTCYNIFLMSRSDVNQQTAKATLTQMLNVVFQRMEADSVFVEVRPIAVTDVLGLPRTSPSDTGSLTSVVQSFLNNVVMVTAGMQAQPGPSPEEVRNSVSAAVMDPRPSPVLGALGTTEPPSPSPHAGPRRAPSAALSVSASTPLSAGGAAGPGEGGLRPSPSGTDLAGPGPGPSAAAEITASGDSTSTVGLGLGLVGPGLLPGAASGALWPVADAAMRTQVLQRDAFLVFRALCKLSIRTNDTTAATDPTAVRGKVLALELVKVLLENSGPVFRRADKFLAAIRQYLCLSLLKNSASSLPAAQALTVSIFVSLLTRFRGALKAEVGVFFPMILLKPLEGQQPPPGANPMAPQPPQPLNPAAVQNKVKSKMSKAGFLKNNRGINDGADLPEEFMSALYDRIVSNEIKMKDEATGGASAAQESGGLAAPARALFNTLLGMMGGRGQAVSTGGPSDAAIRATLDYLHQRAASASTVTVTEPDAVQPLMEVVWAPLLGALSTLFDEYSDPRLVSTCLAGFTAAACLAAQTGLTQTRDLFLNALCNFTHLHSPAAMRPKNAAAFKALLRVAETVGDQLQERWVDVLRCISRWELLQQIASGMPTDAALFRPPEESRGNFKAAAAALGQKIRTVAAELPLGPLGPSRGGSDLADSYFHSVSGPSHAASSHAPSSSALGSTAPSSSLASSSLRSSAAGEASIQRLHIGGSAMYGPPGGKGSHHHHGGGMGGPGGHGGPGDPLAVPPEVINSVDSGDLNRVFLTSGQLNSEAIVEFVKALTSVSFDELRDARAPRVFSLTKIVEVAHFNMTRIRLVWSRIWAVLSEYFISVGCHANLALAMYAVDALRQLAMKFLERDELANYTFQNDFLRPFVVVMRQSQAVEIRELIIRCLSQMILARVTNVKSGWKSMFMVFTTAANDRDPMIVRLAFDTIEKIVREHFTHITETETTTFTDCVNCLIAFTNNPHSLDVALNSIAFLRFCAMKLAEGAIGDVNMLPEGTVPPPLQHHPLRVVAIDANPEASTSFPAGALRGGGEGGGGGGPGSEAPEDLAQQLSRQSSAGDGEEGPGGLASPSRRGPGGDGGMANGSGGRAGAGPGGQAVASAFGSPAAAGHAAAAASGASMSGARTTDPGSRLALQSSTSFAGGRELQQRTLRFIDRDEHVYFWFPLLAGLSELTFDPRQEIRHSALEVLFDILRYHGGSFAQSFWVRIFDSVLLPIFDHVRAEVTDTTTFTSEKRRQQEEQWLYETCTRCLQHLVDLFVQFYDEASTLLSRLLELLRGFMNRSHQSLAAVGVAAFVRLAVNAGPIMNETCWEMVIAALLALLEETSPDLTELTTPPQRLVSGPSGASGPQPEITPAHPGPGPGYGYNPSGGGGGQGTLSQSPPGSVSLSGGSASSSAGGGGGRAFSLREGVGARRLAKFRCQAATQLLLVQGCSEVYAKAAQSLPPGAVRGLLDSLEFMHRHAHTADMNLELRKRLAVQQAEDRVPEDKAVADPPLLRLEVEAAAAYLSVNLAITSAAGQAGAGPDAQALARLTNAQERLVNLCLSTLARYTLGVRHELAGPAAPPQPHPHPDGAPPPPRDRPRLLGFLPGPRGGGGNAPPPPPGPHALPQPRYIIVARTATGAPVLMAPPAVEFASFSPLALSSLCALGELEEGVFRKYVAELFPLLTQLIRADYAPADVHRALSALFARRVQPLVLAAAGVGQQGGVAGPGRAA